MKLNILGSGGATSMPRAFCQCANCEQARERGIPYARTGPSMYVYSDGGILFDTPEEIRLQFERERIQELAHIFYTHWHPDHTQGMRIIENINLAYENEPKRSPINVYLPKSTVDDFEKYCAALWYYEQMGWAKIHIVDDRTPIQLDKLVVTPVNFKRSDRERYGFLIQEDDKKVMYAPCSTFDLKVDDYYFNLDCLIMECGWQGDTDTIRQSLSKNHAWQSHVSFNENLALIRLVRPKQTVLTHIDGCRHKTSSGDTDNLVKVARKTCLNLEIAHDGMKFNV